MTRNELIQAVARELLDSAAARAHGANGEVDKDGIDDFIGPVLQKFAAEVKLAMEEMNS